MTRNALQETIAFSLTTGTSYYTRLQNLLRHRVTSVLIGVTVLILLMVGGFTSCATVIQPPHQPDDPVPVMIIDYGFHSGLVLPRAKEKGAVEFVYGEWNYYALGNNAWYNLFPALLWPTQGGFGKRTLPDTSIPEEVKFRIPAESYHVFDVHRPDVEKLRSRLDEHFRAHKNTRHENEIYKKTFVQDPRSYWVFHNCNHRLVAWLEDLNCTVHGAGFTSNFRIEPAAGNAEPQK